MTTKSRKKDKSRVIGFLEDLNGGALTFGQLFCSIREGEELTQEDFGRLLGISRQKVCDIEKGRRLPSPDKAAEYAKKLGYYPESFAKLIIEEQIKKAGLKLVVVDAA
jgi:transcriptional regulator with XRE-family HTH domain